MATVHQINASGGGVPKLPVASAVINESGLVGDIQADTVHHGSPSQALCLFSLEAIEKMQTEGHPIAPGYAGENLTITGLDWTSLGEGDQLRIGDEILIEITGPTAPCQKNAQWFLNGDILRMSESRHPGESRLYAKVISGGPIAAGDPVELVA